MIGFMLISDEICATLLAAVFVVVVVAAVALVAVADAVVVAVS